MKVSIYTPVYNQQELILRALESVPARDDVEIVLCDDGSSDASLAVMVKYCIDHPEKNIRVMWNEQNIGAARTINRILDTCTGEYVYALDNDDYLYTDEFVKCLDELDGTDIVYVSMRINSGAVWKVTPETKRNLCAGFTKFIRREYLGTKRHPTDIWCSDWHLNEQLQSEPHTEKFTDLIPYHYNFPREGSMIWMASKGMIPEGYRTV